ncbi:hypothetical protein AMECASPLE_031289 [Ameca splendens]|uniref:Uncharacterized protein n=1 Tax=Ameca splendens TaxID=208324 RepID=A0ABV0YHP4_9TELE
MNGLSRQMTQFSIEVNQQLARIRGDLATCNERLSCLESQASCSEELQRKGRQNNPKIATLFTLQRAGHICVGQGSQVKSRVTWCGLCFHCVWM